MDTGRLTKNIGEGDCMKYEYWFANIKGVGNQQKKKLRECVVCAKELYYIEETGLKAFGATEKEITCILESKKIWALESEYEKLEQKQIKFYPYFCDAYPTKLKQISSPPYALYGKGKLPDEETLSVAIVGARECSPYGREMAEWFAKSLAGVGIQNISGMARGVDGASQLGAIRAGGTSVGVLGCGVDVCYPREHIELYTRLERTGGILSEQPVGMKPFPQFFPARNRIISALSDVVLVMEAKAKSGSLITADMALEQGKDVYALPGQVNSQLSRGCNQLIKQGAGILVSPEELLEELGIACREKREKFTENKIPLESPENLVYSCLGLYPKNINELSDLTGMTIPVLLNVLVSLELQGYISEFSKNHYIRLK